MDFNGRPDHIEDVLIYLHSGQWFGWSDSKNKVHENLVIYTADEKPSKEWLESELVKKQEAWDAGIKTRSEEKASAVSKLKALGLNDAEIASIAGA